MAQGVLPVCLCFHRIPYKDNSHCIRAHPDTVWPHLNFTTSAKVLFPNQLHSQVGISTSLFGRHDSTCNKAQWRKNILVRGGQQEQVILLMPTAFWGLIFGSSQFLLPGSCLFWARSELILWYEAFSSLSLQQILPSLPVPPFPACIVPTPIHIPHMRWTRTIKAVSQAGGD